MRRMNCAALAAAFAGLTLPASAADLPVKAPPLAPPQVFSWTGFYVSGGYGYGMYNADTTWFLPNGVPNLPRTQTQGGRGWLGTVGIGYDYQFSSNFVAGVLADYDFASIKGTIQNQGPFTVGTMKETSAWSVGGRLGWLLTPDIMTYVNGGYTQAHFSDADMIVNFGGVGTAFSTVPSQTYSGWFVGTGLETRLPWFGNGWFARAEYRYASYGSKTLPDIVNATGLPTRLVTIEPVVQTVRSELVYKFNPGGVGNSFGAPPAAPAANWTGLYVAGGVGYGMYNADTVWLNAAGATFLPFTQTQGGRGWLGTVGLGYDYQFTDKIVVGVLADYDFASIKGTIQNQGPFTVGTMTENSAWAVGARAGWLVTPQVLSYFSAGYTQAHFSSVDMTINASGAPFSTVPSQTYSGYFLGSGVEAKLPWFGNGWFARTEYRYASYGSKTLPDTCINSGLCTVGLPAAFVDLHPYVQTVRSELVYKFNWGR